MTNLIYNLGSQMFGAYASSSNLFAIIENGAFFITNLIKWGALLYVAIKVCALGWKILSESKKSSDALALVKEQGISLAIGLFIVAATFLIQTTLKDSISGLTSGSGSTTTIGNTQTQFAW